MRPQNVGAYPENKRTRSVPNPKSKVMPWASLSFVISIESLVSSKGSMFRRSASRATDTTSEKTNKKQGITAASIILL